MIDIDKCTQMYNDNRAWYVETIGEEKELINTLYAEVIRLRKGIKAYLNLEIETHELKEMIDNVDIPN